MFRTVSLSIIRSFSLYTQQWYMSYRYCWKLARNFIRTRNFIQRTPHSMSQSQKLLGKFTASPEIHKAGRIGGKEMMLLLLSCSVLLNSWPIWIFGGLSPADIDLKRFDLYLLLVGRRGLCNRPGGIASDKTVIINLHSPYVLNLSVLIT